MTHAGSDPFSTFPAPQLATWLAFQDAQETQAPAEPPIASDQQPAADETQDAIEGVDSGTGAPGQPTQPAPGWFQFFANPIFPLILIFVVFYAFMISGNRKKEKARQALLGSLSRGDRVTTIGGIIGSVVDATGDEVVVKVDESSNTKMRFTRSAIANVVKAGEDKK